MTEVDLDRCMIVVIVGEEEWVLSNLRCWCFGGWMVDGGLAKSCLRFTKLRVASCKLHRERESSKKDSCVRFLGK